MKLSIKATATACSLLWGGGIFTLALANVIWPNYGGKFLRTVASVYPGYNARRTLGDAAIGGLYAMVDGAVGGALYAWLYNRFAPASPGAEYAVEHPQPVQVRGGAAVQQGPTFQQNN